MFKLSLKTQIRICQNLKGEDHFFATLYSTTDRIPVYSAVKIARFSKFETFPRPKNWRLCERLCISDENFTISKNESFLCDSWEIKKDLWLTCGKNQVELLNVGCQKASLRPKNASLPI